MKKWITIILSLAFAVCLCCGLASCGFLEINGPADGSSSGGGNSSGGNNSKPKEDNDGTFIYSGSSVKAANTSISGDIVIPSNHNGVPIDTIPASAFEGCNGITSVTVPESVTSIGSSAFNGCSLLRSVTLPFIGSQKGNNGAKACFGYIFGTDSYQGGTRVIQYCYTENQYAYEDFYIPSVLRSVTITNETVIGRGAFPNCSMLTSITINSAAQNNIGLKAFDNTADPTWN